MQQDCWSSDLGLYWLVLRFTMSSAMRMIMIGYVVGLAVAALAAEEPWHAMYDGSFKTLGVRGWSSASLTRSELTPEGLRVVDPSTEKGSGRFYELDWHVKPDQGATVETRLKVVSCSSPWGVALLVADGVHEEGVTFFPDKIELAGAKLSVPFDAASALHTYRIQIRSTDIKIWENGKLLLDGTGKFTAVAHHGRNEIGFGCASSTATGEAIWQFVRFQGGNIEAPQAKLSIPNVAGLEVRIGETQTIVPEGTYLSMFKFNDGSIVVDGKRSSDAGKTWHTARGFHVGAFQFLDGEIVQLGFSTKKTDREGYFSNSLTCSVDNGLTLKSETATIHIPEGSGGTGDDGSWFEGPVVDHTIVQLRDGSLLAAMYGQFKTDRVPVPTMPAKWNCFKYRTFVVRSTDRGRTWDYLATVAYDPGVGLESFCEPDLLPLPDGGILCFMRTGGSGGKFTPLYLSRSNDDGKTWSTPEAIADRGVWPNACRMKNGVLVCTYGRPGNWLMFSLDDGRTWLGHFCFHDGVTTSYNSVEEVEPDTLLVVFDAQQLDASGNLMRRVMGQRVTVKRR